MLLFLSRTLINEPKVPESSSTPLSRTQHLVQQQMVSVQPSNNVYPDSFPPRPLLTAPCGPSGLPRLLIGLPTSAKVIPYRFRTDHVTLLLRRIPLHSFKANILKNTSTIRLPPQHPPVTPVAIPASLLFLEPTRMSHLEVCHPADASFWMLFPQKELTRCLPLGFYSKINSSGRRSLAIYLKLNPSAHPTLPNHCQVLFSIQAHIDI